jgi:hypothetical protein
MSPSRLVAYWVTTGLVASSIVSGGVAHVLDVRASLGDPVHFVTLDEQDALAEGGCVTKACPIRFGLVFRVSPIELKQSLQRRSH